MVGDSRQCDPDTVINPPYWNSQSDPQADHNAAVWREGSYLGDYASRELRPAERVFLERFDERLRGRVLEIGCGAGRLTGHLLGIAESVHGIDISPRMVEHCRRAYPRGTYSVLDLRNLGELEEDSADAVIATYNVLDVLGDTERRRVLGEIRRVLVPDGLLMMSAHNLAFLPRLREPTDLRGRTPIRSAGRLVLMPFRLRNRRAVQSMQRRGLGYAIVNDDAHGYRLLHYYIARDAQERQLEDQGFELIECLDNDGHTVARGDRAEEYVELYYVAVSAQSPPEDSPRSSPASSSRQWEA
jgi:SAM-dependent methyltransferase